MNTDKVIIISGCQGSGKSTLMDNLIGEMQKNTYYLCIPLNFADTVYKIHDFALKTLKSCDIPVEGNKDGGFLQVVGEYFKGKYGKDVWVNTLKGQINQSQKNYSDEGEQPICFFLGDTRFRNEVDAFPEAFKIRLEASREVRKARCKSWRDNDTHISETDLDTYARSGSFDLYLDTESNDTSTIHFTAQKAFAMWEYGKHFNNNFSKINEKFYKTKELPTVPQFLNEI